MLRDPWEYKWYFGLLFEEKHDVKKKGEKGKTRQVERKVYAFRQEEINKS